MTKKGKTILVSAIGGVLVLGGIGALTDKGSDKTNLPNSSNSSISTTTDSDLNSSENNIISSTELEIPSRDTATGKSDKSIDGIIQIKTATVPNDKTGNWRYSAYSESDLDISEYALSYYDEYFTSDKEIHAVVNFAAKTTTKISCSDGMLFVTVHKYVDGEEHDADLMFSGDVISDYIVYADNGDIESLDMPEPAPSESETETSTSTETKPQSTVSEVTTPTKPTETSSSTMSVTPPKEITYVLNTATHKVHKLNCRDVDKIDPENYATTTNLQNAINNGYTACGHCRPF